MAGKTLLLKQLTTGNVGDPGLEKAMDITPQIIALAPTLANVSVSARYRSTILPDRIEEGIAEILIDRKVHVKTYSKTSDLHDNANATGGKSVGPVSTAGYTTTKRDKITVELDGSWDVGESFDKKKDPKVAEGKVMAHIVSITEDVIENKDALTWSLLNDDLDATDGATSKKYDKYVSSRDGKTKASPALVHKLTVNAAKTIEEKRLLAGLIIDFITDKIDKIAKIGKKSTGTEGYPYARGTRNKLGLEVVTSAKIISIMSYDDRYVQASIAADIVKTGVFGSINNTPVLQDDTRDVESKFDIDIMPRGKFGAVGVYDEADTDIVMFDHPTKPTRTKLLEGSGAYSGGILPFVLLSSHIILDIQPHTTTVTSDAPEETDTVEVDAFDAKTFKGDVTQLTGEQRTELKTLFELPANSANAKLQEEINKR